MTGIFLQARLDSVRLPRKALLKLEGRAVIEHAMRALQNIDVSVYALLTDRESAPELAPVARACDFTVFTGPRDDVLRRFADAVRFYGVNTVVRATGDNPLVSPRLVRRTLELAGSRDADFAAYAGTPLGTGVEVASAEALLTADRESTDVYEREHVTPYLYRNGHRFTTVRLDCPPEFRLPGARVTLDTEEDYAELRRIYRALYRGAPIDLEELVPWLRQHMHGEASRERSSA